MKKLILMSLVIGMLAGCKKGPNDPGISWRSRDGRLIGEWTMESFEETASNRSGATSQSTNTKYDGSKVTTVVTTNGMSGNPNTSTTTYKGTLIIDKDGTITFTVVSTPQTGAGTTNKEVGNWRWLDGKKNKSSILISDISTTLFDEGEYRIDELRHKKLVLKHASSTEMSGGTSSGSSFDNTYTFTQ